MRGSHALERPCPHVWASGYLARDSARWAACGVLSGSDCTPTCDTGVPESSVDANDDGAVRGAGAGSPSPGRWLTGAGRGLGASGSLLKERRTWAVGSLAAPGSGQRTALGRGSLPALLHIPSARLAHLGRSCRSRGWRHSASLRPPRPPHPPPLLGAQSSPMAFPPACRTQAGRLRPHCPEGPWWEPSSPVPDSYAIPGRPVFMLRCHTCRKQGRELLPRAGVLGEGRGGEAPGRPGLTAAHWAPKAQGRGRPGSPTSSLRPPAVPTDAPPGAHSLHLAAKACPTPLTTWPVPSLPVGSCPPRGVRGKGAGLRSSAAEGPREGPQEKVWPAEHSHTSPPSWPPGPRRPGTRLHSRLWV